MEVKWIKMDLGLCFNGMEIENMSDWRKKQCEKRKGFVEYVPENTQNAMIKRQYAMYDIAYKKYIVYNE